MLNIYSQVKNLGTFLPTSKPICTNHRPFFNYFYSLCSSDAGKGMLNYQSIKSSLNFIKHSLLRSQESLLFFVITFPPHHFCESKFTEQRNRTNRTNTGNIFCVKNQSVFSEAKCVTLCLQHQL